MMKLFCGKQKTLDIVRVDQGVTWRIEEKQRRYTESALSSPEQWQTAMKQQQADYDKLRSCPTASDSAPAGKSAGSTITTPVAARPDETPSCPSS
jgi:hypothetical protein